MIIPRVAEHMKKQHWTGDFIGSACSSDRPGTHASVDVAASMMIRGQSVFVS